eukprot:m.172429 g.172429  ORF g.172429 m.172429 type:complete len:922 (+) comp24285_c0_seq1:102-2867(+)
MGSGSSKDTKPAKTLQATPGKSSTTSTTTPMPATARAGTLSTSQSMGQKQPLWKRASKSDAEFEKYLKTVFRRADQDGSGFLDKDEIRLVLFSPKLGLNLTEEEAQTVILEYDASHDGEIDYDEFSNMLQHLLQMVQSKVENPVNDWACIEDPVSKATVYFNKRTGKTQKSRPMTFNPERVEFVTTRHVTVADGSTVTVRLNDQTNEDEYIDFETGEWRPFNPADFEPAAPLEYRGIPIAFEVGDAWKAYAEDLDNPPFQKYRVPLQALLDVDTNLKALCDDLAMDFPDMKENTQMLAIAATISGYDYNDAKEFISANKLSSVKALSANQAEDEKLSSEKIEELEMANADLKKASDNLGDAVADAKAEASKLAEQNRLLTERCAKLKDWQSRSSAHGGSANGAGAPDAMEVEDLKNDKEALQNELTSLKKTLEAQQELTAKKNEAASAAAAAGDPEHVATIAALTAEVQALKERDTASNAGKEKAEAATRSLQAQLSKSSGATNQLAKKMRYLMKEVRETRAAAETTKTDMVTFVNTVKPMMKRSLNEARALNDKVAETHRVVTGKYLKESALRKKYYNQIQELKGNIRVFVRVRKDDRGDYKKSGVFDITSDTQTSIQNPNADAKPFKFEFAKVYGPKSTQEQVFADTRDTLMSVVDGFNVCIMAYGQTGSGKTFTMMGPPDNPGVNRRAIRELLERLALSKAEGDIEYLLEASQLEVYNEGIYDLLSMEERAETKIKPRTIGKNVELPGLTWRNVLEPGDVEKVMTDGDKHRSTAATAMNSASSRSHLVLQLRVTITNLVTKKTFRSVLTLVDLAGSERVSKSEVSGNGLVEAAAINKSLSSLGQVFLALSKGDPHIPYRNSALTTVLQETLGGNAKCCMFANASPLESNLAETISTLKYATTITKIELGHAKSNRAKK